MSDPIRSYFDKRLEMVKVALEANHFEVYLADTVGHARTVVIERILPTLAPKSVSWAGSMTLAASGLREYFMKAEGFEVIDTADGSIPKEERLERCRQALLVDLFLTGTNAITEAGQLVNLDMTGNRIGGITFGPRHVVLLVGRNKITADLDTAMLRIKNYAAPVNAMRLGRAPCATTSVCEDCSGPQRICNTWTITEKCYPKGRIKIVLVNEDLGF